VLLIFTKESDELTNAVIELIDDEIEVFKLLVDQPSNFPKIRCEINNSNNHKLLINDVEVKVVWFRKSFRLEYLDKDFMTNHSNPEMSFVYMEWKKIYENLHSVIKLIDSIDVVGGSKYSDFNNINKLEVLAIASSIGITIPNSLMTNVLEIKQNTSYITKPVSEFKFITRPNKLTGLYTRKVDSSIDFEIAPSLIQDEIEKIADIRMFYLNKRIYTGAIIQAHGVRDSQIDYRRYQTDKMPYWKRALIPVSLWRMVIDLMDRLQANFGVIDFVTNDFKNFTFLEINLGGQFSDLSSNCNYNLELEFASYLNHLYNES